MSGASICAATPKPEASMYRLTSGGHIHGSATNVQCTRSLTAMVRAWISCVEAKQRSHLSCCEPSMQPDCELILCDNVGPVSSLLSMIKEMNKGGRIDSPCPHHYTTSSQKYNSIQLHAIIFELSTLMHTYTHKELKT